MPVFLPYLVGIVLVIFGSLRALMLGWQRRNQPVDDEVGARKKGPRYHLMVGILWMVMGLFLVISTYYQTHRFR
jgi:hypothetical protein